MISIIRQNFAFNYPSPRKLREIVKLSLLQKENPQSIASIWNSYHNERSKNVAFVWDKQSYLHLKGNAIKGPMFIFPVFKENGYFMLLSQFQDKSFLFTYLEQYKKKGINASPYLVLTCFEQLMNSKGVVLIRGDIIQQRLNEQESKKVCERLLRYYLRAQLFSQYVEKFNRSPNQFKFQEYLEQCKV